MWEKSRMILNYIVENFLNDFDYFIFGGDDTFWVIPNLQFYLSTDPLVLEAEKNGIGLYMGRRMFNGQQRFNSGGGYVFNKKALQVWGMNCQNYKANIVSAVTCFVILFL
jgi:hypothetical protein